MNEITVDKLKKKIDERKVAAVKRMQSSDIKEQLFVIIMKF